MKLPIILVFDSMPVDYCRAKWFELIGNKTLKRGNHANKGYEYLNKFFELYDFKERPKVYIADYEGVFPNNYYDFIDEFIKEIGKPCLIAHTYSAKEDWYLATKGRREIDMVHMDDLCELHIAAAGHMGKGGIRFPASANSIVAVGVSHDNGISHFTGTCSYSNKPNLLMDQLPFQILLNGKTVLFDGTSAAVWGVIAIATCWALSFHSMGKEPSSAELHALLIAISKSTPDGYKIPTYSPKAISLKHIEVYDFSKTCKLKLQRTIPYKFIVVLPAQEEGSIFWVKEQLKTKVRIIDSKGVFYDKIYNFHSIDALSCSGSIDIEVEVLTTSSFKGKLVFME